MPPVEAGSRQNWVSHDARRWTTNTYNGAIVEVALLEQLGEDVDEQAAAVTLLDLEHHAQVQLTHEGHLTRDCRVVSPAPTDRPTDHVRQG
jgi:hypothetical protein